MYVERMKYGRYVAKITGKTIGGSNYCFKKKGRNWIGGPHNYRQIIFVEYVLLSIKYFVLEFVFKNYYEKIKKESWV